MFEYGAELVNVVDGDTFDFLIDMGFNIQHKIRVRLFGVDTPEIYHPRNRAELAHGLEAKEFVERHFLGKKGIVNTVKDRKGKYGRYLANFTICTSENEILNLAISLVEAGLEKKDVYEES